MTTENLEDLKSRKRTLSSTSVDQCRRKLSRPLVPIQNISTRLRIREKKPFAQNSLPLSENSSKTDIKDKSLTEKSVNKKDGKKEILTDPHRLEKRQRQLDIGKNTPGYSAYLNKVPRIKRTSKHPYTPDKFRNCSTRSWQAQIKTWRRQLHIWDPPEVNDENVADPFH